MERLEDVIAPRLIDESAKYYLDGALKKSHEIRTKFHRILWNGGLVFIFCSIVGAFLYYRYTHRPTHAEANYKLIKDQEYVLSKIRWFQDENRRIQEANNRRSSGAEITGLPVIHPDSNT